MGTAKTLIEDVRVGVMACEGVAPMMRRMPTPPGLLEDRLAPEPFVVAFDEFKIVSTGLK